MKILPIKIFLFINWHKKSFSRKPNPPSFFSTGFSLSGTGSSLVEKDQVDGVQKQEIDRREKDIVDVKESEEGR